MLCRNLNPSRYLPLLLLGLWMFACKPDEIPVTPSGDPYNILLIVTDDLGLELGYLGNEVARTPVLDSLARHSVVYPNAYAVTSSCSPSRASLYTGLYPHQHGHMGLAPNFSIGEEHQTMAELLKDLSTFTAYMGKTHLVPEERFVDVNWKQLSLGETRDFPLTLSRLQTAINQARNRPWRMMLNVYDPHRDVGDFLPVVNFLPANPQTATDVQPLPFQEVATQEQMEDVAGYYNQVARIDAGMGLILDMLREAEILEETIIIFTSDHGPPFTRAKTSLYEAGTRIPLLIYMPHEAVTPRVDSGYVSLLDILPTMLELTGKEGPPYDLAGKSLLPNLIDQVPIGREYMVTEFNWHSINAFFPRRAIRKGDYKLICNVDTARNFPFYVVDTDRAFNQVITGEAQVRPEVREAFRRYGNPPKYELFNIASDPYEFINLADDPTYSGKLAELLEDLTTWRLETQDEIPTEN